MKRLTPSFITLLLVLSSAIADAQDFKQAVSDFQKKYQSAENLRIRMSIDAFISKSMKQPFYQEKVTISKRGTAYHNRLSASEMVMNEKYIVVVDHSNKEIALGNRDLRTEKEFYNQVQFDLDSTLKFYDEAKFVGIVSGVSHFSIVQKKGDIEKIDLFFKQETGDLKQINYLYKSGNWVAISIDEFNVSPTFENTEFDETQFLKKEGRSWRPTVALAGYKVLKTN
ncbi:MAG: hypothetical protein WDO14_24555 [Bacteroidota bacterium]